MMSIPIISDIDAARASILQRAPLDEDQDTAEKVATIVRDVRQRGDAALREWTQHLDGVTLEQFAVPAERIAAAAASLAPDLRAALQLAATELERFHRHQVRNTWVDVNAEGLLGQMIVPLNQVGIYVPSGTAPLPSSLLHAAIPARVAGVSELIVCSPPQRDSGQPADLILAAAHIVGVQHVFALGGAQAIAAMAYGTASIPRVDKIVGPGNQFVTMAKKLVFGAVGIESLAGPTETLVIADASADPRYVAADLLAQAEHIQASAILLTPSSTLAHAVQAEVERQLVALPTTSAHNAAEAVTQRGGIVLVDNLEQAFDLSNAYGPEHLCLLIDNSWDYVGRVRNAGGIFLGERSFEVLGDYVAGPSHIMPTDGTARYASPVNVDDFRKVISLIGLNQTALERIGPAAARLADAEGLFAHAAAVRARLAE